MRSDFQVLIHGGLGWEIWFQIWTMEVDWRDLRFFKFEIESVCLEIRERESERERERKLFKGNKVYNRWSDVGAFAKWLCKIEKVGFYCKIEGKF